MELDLEQEQGQEVAFQRTAPVLAALQGQQQDPLVRHNVVSVLCYLLLRSFMCDNLQLQDQEEDLEAPVAHQYLHQKVSVQKYYKRKYNTTNLHVWLYFFITGYNSTLL